MSKDITLKQADFLYGLEWTPKMDREFSEALSDNVLMGMFDANGDDNFEAVDAARFVVNMLNKTSFAYEFCAIQVERLRMRHGVFSWLIRLEGVEYNEATNHVRADDNTWYNIIQENQFAQAYQKNGDPAWEFLKVIFGEPTDERTQLDESPTHFIEHIEQLENDAKFEIKKDKDVVGRSGSSGNTSSFNRFWKGLSKFSDNSSSINSKPSASEDISGTPTKGPPPSWVNASPWKK